MCALLAGCVPYSNLFLAVLGIERNLAGLEPHSIDVNGQTIAYLERPGPGETLFLIHGFAADKDNWTRFVRYLPDSYRVIVPDLPGHGESSYEQSLHYDAPSMTATLADMIEQLQLGPVHVAGNSLGGWIATLYAAGYPEQTLSLTLIDAAGVVPPQRSELQIKLLEGENPLIVETPDDFQVLLNFVFFNEPFLPWPFKPEMARIFAQRADINRKIWADVSAELEDVAPLLETLQLPVLVMWGAEDRVLHVSSVEVYRQHLSDVRSVVIKQCGHSPIAEVPKLSAGYVSSFLAGELETGAHVETAPEKELGVQSRERSR